MFEKCVFMDYLVQMKVFKKQCHCMCKYKASMFPEANNELRTEAASPSFSVQNEIVETIKCVAPLVRV